jgi:hypothetical protein
MPATLAVESALFAAKVSVAGGVRNTSTVSLLTDRAIAYFAQIPDAACCVVLRRREQALDLLHLD